MFDVVVFKLVLVTVGGILDPETVTAEEAAASPFFLTRYLSGVLKLGFDLLLS